MEHQFSNSANFFSTDTAKKIRDAETENNCVYPSDAKRSLCSVNYSNGINLLKFTKARDFAWRKNKRRQLTKCCSKLKFLSTLMQLSRACCEKS
jgi:hypothetical protein